MGVKCAAGNESGTGVDFVSTLVADSDERTETRGSLSFNRVSEFVM